jgi:integrase
MVENVKSAGDGLVSGSAWQTGSLPPPGRPLGGSQSGPNWQGQSTPVRAGHLRLDELIEIYMARYAGRDASRVQRLSWWSAKLGHVSIQDLSDDEVHSALQSLATQPSRYYAGKDASEKPIYKAKQKRLSAATVNRYAAALGAVLTWAIKQRIAPKGYNHPCRTLARQPENNEKTRFLSDDERERLLAACRESRWLRLYLLVVLALTTGARKGELLGLRWTDIDLQRSLAYCGRTKNGDAKALPLIPIVTQELQNLHPKTNGFVFCGPRSCEKPYAFESQWQSALKVAKIRNFRFHDLRHTCASMLAQSGATLLEIADVLGHRQLQMTKRYSHLTTHHKAALVNRVLGSVQ